MTQSSSLWRAISATLLVTGTCVGAGMLALPVTTFQMGFLPSLAIMAVCWIFMTCTALLLAEASLWMDEGAHYATMSRLLLGPWATVLSWILYLFIAYGTLIAYVSEGGVLLQSFLASFGSIAISKSVGQVMFATLFGGIILTGGHITGVINAILVFGMAIAYLFLTGVASESVQIEWLETSNWSYALGAIPFMLPIFSFQSMVPSLTSYLNRDAKALRWSIVIGTALSFVIYAIWQAVVLGSVPAYGEFSLEQAFLEGKSTASIMRKVINNDWLVLSAEIFSLFAIMTSFLGIGLGLFDFLADGLKIKKTYLNKIGLIVMIILPSLIWALFYPRIFLVALELTGAFGDSILNGILPVLMVWSGRYYQMRLSNDQVLGGKPALVMLLIFSFVAILSGF
ncbi:MAG: tyrP 3 [Chlamydiales bacterium]|jgi:tyrosine-specific transport protein|nr:tyrP 3 [Chlamydiales bacterium]